MRTIPLTQGYEALVDDEDYEELSKHKWFASIDGRGFPYAARNYRTARGKSILLLHRYLMGVQDAGRSVEVDHRNHNTLDNTRENLRVCTHADNQQNRTGADIDSFTGVRNVCFHRASGKYMVTMTLFGKRHYFGLYSTLEEAAQVAETERTRAAKVS
jgi:hypothetical protein